MFETSNDKYTDIIVDTSSVNKLILNKQLSDLFFNIVDKNDYRVVVPYEAFSELSVEDETLNKFKLIYDKHTRIIIGPPPPIAIKQEIDSPITSIYDIKKQVDVFKKDETCRQKIKERCIKRKNAWKSICERFRKGYVKKFNKTPEERNQEITEILSNVNLFKYYEEKHRFWILDVVSRIYQVEFQKDKIINNKQRYRYITLLYFLMVFNVWKSLVSGRSEFSAHRGDLSDMEIAFFSAYSRFFISEDRKLIELLRKIKDNSKSLGFENNCELSHKIEEFIDFHD